MLSIMSRKDVGLELMYCRAPHSSAICKGVNVYLYGPDKFDFYFFLPINVHLFKHDDEIILQQSDMFHEELIVDPK